MWKTKTIPNGPDKLSKRYQIQRSLNYILSIKKVKIKETEIAKHYETGHGLKKFFTGIGSHLASSVTNTAKSFKDYLILFGKDLEFHEPTIEDFETAFKSLKINKIVGDDVIKANIVPSI